MSRKITCKNGRTFTYLSPKEKYEKYKIELDVNYKFTGDFFPKVSAGYQPQKLTAIQRKYREDYISAYDSFYSKSSSKGTLDFRRDCENYMKYYSGNRNNKT